MVTQWNLSVLVQDYRGRRQMMKRNHELQIGCNTTVSGEWYYDGLSFVILLSANRMDPGWVSVPDLFCGFDGGRVIFLIC